MTSHARIGEGEAIRAAPALRRSIAEIVAEYDRKTKAIAVSGTKLPIGNCIIREPGDTPFYWIIENPNARLPHVPDPDQKREDEGSLHMGSRPDVHCLPL